MKAARMLPPVLALAVSCGPGAGATAVARRARVSDGAHGGNRHFFYLPPLVRAPSPTGTFDGTLEPEVRICALDASGRACAPDLYLFDALPGPGTSSVRVDAVDEHYIVDWHTSDLPAGVDRFRIQVWVGQQPLGHADVELVEGGRALKIVDGDDLIGLVDGRTLPIKFRIEEGAVLSVAIALSPLAAGKTAGSGSATIAVSGDFPHLSWDCTLNGVALPDCTSPLEWSGLPDGSTVAVAVTATDLDSGFETTAVASAVVDAVAPTLFDLYWPPPGTTTGSFVVIAFRSSDSPADGASFSCELHPIGPFQCAPGVEADFVLPSGEYILTIVATDAVGNRSTMVDVFDVDATGPVFDLARLRIPSGPVCPSSTAETAIQFVAIDSFPSSYPLTLECLLDGWASACRALNPSEFEFDWSGLAGGAHELRVTAIDASGNRSAAPLVVDFVVDRQLDSNADGVPDCPP